MQSEEATGIKDEAKTWAWVAGWMVALFIKVEKTGEEAGLGLMNDLGFRRVKI